MRTLGFVAIGSVTLLGVALYTPIAEAATIYTLIVCAEQPNDEGFYSGHPTLQPGEALAGRVSSSNPLPHGKSIDTIICQTQRYPKGTDVFLHARVLKLGKNKHQAGFLGWAESGSVYPKTGAGNGRQVNSCRRLGKEPTCKVKMNKHRYVRAVFGLGDPDKHFLWDLGDGVPVCEVFSMEVDSPRGLCILESGLRIEFDLNRGVVLGKEVNTIFYDGLGCTGYAYTEGTADGTIYRTRVPDPAAALSEGYFTAAHDGGDMWDEFAAYSMYAVGLGCQDFEDMYVGRGTEVIWRKPGKISLGGDPGGGDVGYAIR